MVGTGISLNAGAVKQRAPTQGQRGRRCSARPLSRYVAGGRASRSVVVRGLARSRALIVTSTADRADLASMVDDRLREVAKRIRRSMLDALPDGEPNKWLYGPIRDYPYRP